MSTQTKYFEPIANNFPLQLPLKEWDSIFLSQYIIIAKKSKSHGSITMKYLNTLVNNWQNVAMTIEQSLKLQRFIFPVTNQLNAICKSSKLNVINLYIKNNIWIPQNTPKKTQQQQQKYQNYEICQKLIKVTIKLNDHQGNELMDIIELDASSSSSSCKYTEIVCMKILRQQLHVFQVEKNETCNEYQLSHKILNKTNNEFDQNFIINWIPNFSTDHMTSITANEINNTLLMQCEHVKGVPIDYYSFFEFDLQKGWNKKEKMTHGCYQKSKWVHKDDDAKNNNNKSLIGSVIEFDQDTKILYLKPDIKVIFDGYSSKVWIQKLNTSNNYIATGITLPTFGSFQIWCDEEETKQTDDKLVFGYSRKSESYQMHIPHYLTQIVLGYYHQMQIHLILEQQFEQPWAVDEPKIESLSTWRIDPSHFF